MFDKDHVGPPSKRIEKAIKDSADYEFEDLLRRRVLDPFSNAYAVRLAVPDGGLRAFHYNGQRYRLTLRKTILLLYHESEAMGAHQGFRDTLAKIKSLFWWPSLDHDVKRWVATCTICRVVKPTPALTAELRSQLHNRPFATIFVDTIGPISPSDGKYKYIAHAECPFSRFVWLKPFEEDDGKSWAKFLVEDVFFDLAGFPKVLRSDRGAAFCSSIVKAVNDYLGIEHAFGAAFHPESQGYIEGRHKSINYVLAAYHADNPGKWARRAKLAQWALRATPRTDRDGQSPYEIVTGLQPQGPLHGVFARTSTTTLSPHEYVRDLVTHLKTIQDGVSATIVAEFEKKTQKYKSDTHSSWLPQVGDIVFLRRPPQAVLKAQQSHLADESRLGYVSARLLPLADPRPFRIKKVVGDKSFILADPDTGCAETSFSQPVALSRLIPFEEVQVEEPIKPNAELYIEIKSNKPEFSERWLTRKIVAQNSSGKVRLVSLSGDHEDVVDLTEYEWRWTSPPTAGLIDTSDL